MAEKKDEYGECRHIKRTKPDVTVNEEIAKEIGSNYRTLPMFEKGLSEHIYVKHYSLKRNELLRCQWALYKKNIEQRVYAPFQFVNIRDFHFYNGSVKIMPSVTPYKYPEHKKKLKPGPGVDSRGELPIPQESMMKRGGKVEKHDGVKKKDGGKNAARCQKGIDVTVD